MYFGPCHDYYPDVYVATPDMVTSHAVISKHVTNIHSCYSSVLEDS